MLTWQRSRKRFEKKQTLALDYGLSLVNFALDRLSQDCANSQQDFYIVGCSEKKKSGKQR